MSLSDELTRIQGVMRACIQCGTCSASCPNEFAMDDTPRQLWRMVLLGEIEGIFRSRTFNLCSDCYCCTLRCPRGLPLTETMMALKRMAADQEADRHRNQIAFYRSFLQSVRYHGRVNETELMGLYFLTLRRPLVALGFVPLGLRLMLKGKISPLPPLGRSHKLDALFSRIFELEER
jgi:heterodisulfide reductase subunit C